MTRPVRIILARLLVGALLLVGGLAVYGPLPAPLAHTQTTILHCNGTESVEYNPGITYIPRTIKVKGRDLLGPCVPTQSGLSGGHAEWEFTAVRSCLTVAPDPGPVTFKWNNGMKSTIYFSSTSTAVNANGEVVVISEGTVTDGFGEGAQAVETLTLLQSDLTACSTSEGVVSLAGPLTLDLVL